MWFCTFREIKRFLEATSVSTAIKQMKMTKCARLSRIAELLLHQDRDFKQIAQLGKTYYA